MGNISRWTRLIRREKSIQIGGRKTANVATSGNDCIAMAKISNETRYPQAIRLLSASSSVHFLLSRP